MEHQAPSPFSARARYLVRAALTALLFGAAVCIAQRLTFALRFPPFQRSAIWTPGAIIFTALLVAPSRRWWIYYIGSCTAAVGAYFDDRVIPLSTALVGLQFFFFAVALGAAYIRRYCSELPFQSPAALAVFVVFAVVLVPILAEAPQVLIRFASGAKDIWGVALRNVLGIVLGLLSATPALTLTLTNGRAWVRAVSWKLILELTTLTVLLLAVGYVSFGSSADNSTSPALLYAPLPLLLWAAARFGLAGVSWAILGVAFQAVWGALHGLGPFASAHPAENVLQLQLFLLSIALPLMFLASMIEEGRRSFVALSREIVEHNQADDRFRLVVESAPSAIVMINQGGIIVLVNQQTENSFGYRRDELVGQPIEILVPERSRASLPGYRAEFFASPTIRSMGTGRELFGRRKDGSEFPVEIGLTPLQSKEGLLVLGTIVDVTERKQAEETRQELAHASRLAIVGELTASIAHEINQPLGAILSNADAAEMLLESAPSSLDEVRQILDDIRKDDLRASEVIRRLRALLRKREMEMQPLDMNGVITEVLWLVRTEAQRRGVTVEKLLADDLPVVCGDKVHMQQVLLNLFLNGMEAMAEVQGLKRICVRTLVNRDGLVEVSVSDKGPGILPDRLSRLFEPFYSTKKEGMGMGLSIARTLVEAHGGRIWAENNSEGGSTFRFTIPTSVHHQGQGSSDAQPAFIQSIS